MDCTLLDLPAEIIFMIFGRCDKKDIWRLRLTCMSLKNFIDVWLAKPAKRLLATNLNHKSIQNRSAKSFTPIEKFRISKNWKCGRYSMEYIRFSKTNCMPWIQLTDEVVWLSSNKALARYKRSPQKLEHRPTLSWNVPYHCEVNKFVYHHDQIVSADSDGCLSLWTIKKEETVKQREKVDSGSLTSVDLQDGVITCGSNNGVYSMYSLSNLDEGMVKISQGQLADRIWTISMNGNKAAIGSMGCHNMNSLHILDLETTTICHKLGRLRGSGVFGIKWESPNILYACEHNSFINKWDLRHPSFPVQTWTDPFQEAVYCLETDNCWTLVTGAQFYGRIVLWDTRCLRYQQLYYLKDKLKHNRGTQTLRSPVYSLSFDAGQLFAVTDQRLYTLDFSVKIGGITEDLRFMGFDH